MIRKYSSDVTKPLVHVMVVNMQLCLLVNTEILSMVRLMCARMMTAMNELLRMFHPHVVVNFMSLA